MEVSGVVSFLPVVISVTNPSAFKGKWWWTYLERLSPIEGPSGVFLVLISIVMLVFIAKNIYQLFLQRRFAKYSLEVSGRYTAAMLKSLMSLPLVEFNQLPTGRNLRNIVNIPQFFTKNILIVALQMTTEVAVLLLLVGLMGYANIKLLLLILFTVGGISAILYTIYRTYFKKVGELNDQIQQSILKDVVNMVGGFIDLRLAGKDWFYINKLIGNLRRSNKWNLGLETAKAIPGTVLEVTAVLAIFMIFLYILVFEKKPEMLYPFLVLYGISSFRIIPSVNRLLSYLFRIRTFEYTINELVLLSPYANWEAEVTDNQRATFTRDVCLRNITFEFPDSEEAVFSNLNICINKGETLGIVGESGAGKSTLLHLLLFLHKPTSGEVLLDGTAIEFESPVQYRNLFSYVRQDVYVMEGSLAQNIALGISDDQIDRKLLTDCINQASLGPWVESLSEGIYKPLSESGKNLSGGEKQRLAIARALYAQSEILVFDEPIASLDDQNAAVVLETIARLKQAGKTILIVSHQPEALKDCDRVLVLEDGTLVERPISI